jgi:hypothetical protein
MIKYKMQDLREVMERLEHITEEIIQTKKRVMKLEVGDKEKREGAWGDLMAASEEISNRWRGYSAVEEVKSQREK